MFCCVSRKLCEKNGACSLTMGEPRPCTPPSGPMQRRKREALEIPDDSAMSAPASVHGSRNTKRRIDFDSVSREGRVLPLGPLEFHVYLPNRTSVEIRVAGEKCAKLTVQGFVKLIKDEMSGLFDPRVKQKQRDILWGDHVHIEDFHGEPVDDCEFALGHESKAARVLLLYVSNFAFILSSFYLKDRYLMFSRVFRLSHTPG